jgi:hypothetical protein
MKRVRVSIAIEWNSLLPCLTFHARLQIHESFYNRQAQAEAKRKERLEAIRSEVLAAEMKYGLLVHCV